MQTRLSVRLAAVAAFLVLTCGPAFSQQFRGPARERIAGPIDGRSRVGLRGFVDPRAEDATPLGAIDPETNIPNVTIAFKPSAEQAQALAQYLSDLQNPSSPNYHKWLTPEQYADRFGAAQGDVEKIVNWLQANQLSVDAVSRARTWIRFSGSAAAVEQALGTKLRRVVRNGEEYYANAGEPSIPAAMQPLVSSIHGLTNFRMKPPRRATEPKPVSMDPRYNSRSGFNYLAPGDFRIIYNVAALHSAGYTGAGQKIAVVGQSALRLSDIQTFRSTFGLPATDPQSVSVPNLPVPDIVSGDVTEANLDVQWSGAVAPNASIIYVYSKDVMDAAQYVLDQNIAPVMSMSYGSCEAESAQSDSVMMQQMAQQAVAQGITWLAASGDDGAGDCGTSSRVTTASVDMPASIPEVTGVGGTTFDEGTGTYWGPANDAYGVSALSYIPETSWNDTSGSSLSSSGGGVSTFYQRPSWQTGAGAFDTAYRTVPDVSMSASSDHDGYLIYDGGSRSAIGGTSAGPPTIAGILALLNQYLVQNGMQAAPGLGNINPKLYALAQTNPSVFHDVTTGNNIVTLCSHHGTCSGSPIGFNAGPGYDQVTGLGTLDAYGLVMAWTGAVVPSPKSSASVSVAASSTTLDAAGSTTLTATVKGTGVAPTGSVAFVAGSTTLGTAALVAADSTSATATLSVNASQLPPGSTNVAAQYSGDTVYYASSAAISITVAGASSGATTPAITGLTDAASYRQLFAPGQILSIWGTALASSTASANSVPLPTSLGGVSVTINGIPAPLYYASATQINVQIPYELPSNGFVTVAVNNNGQTITAPMFMQPAAPGMFVDAQGAPAAFASGRAGDTVALFITGAGALSPYIPTGSSPAANTPLSVLPRPTASVSVTVDGLPATVAFIGETPGLVGVVQINYTIPTGVLPGARQVKVRVGNATSAAATLTVNP